MLCGASDHGDEVWFRKGLDTDGYVIDIDPSGYTVDKTEFDPSEVTVEDGAIVVEGISGTRPSAGFGNAGYANARLEVSGDGSRLVETH